MEISVRFMHGLGDASNFAHAIPLYLKRGHSVAVECTPDKEVIFRAAGATITKTARHVHPYPHAPAGPLDPYPPPWGANKVAWGSFISPMPEIGPPDELWRELCAVDLSGDSRWPAVDLGVIGERLANLPRPYVLLHTRGNSTPHKTNLDDATERDLYFHLLHRLEGTVILLDWDNRVAQLNHYRLRTMAGQFWRMDLPALRGLMQLADLFIGVDSGPLAFARFANVPTLGIWLGHYPANFVLPNDRALHLVAAAHQDTDRRRRVPYNTELMGAGARIGETVADRAGRLIYGRKYLPPSKIARDLQLQSFVRRTCTQAEFNGGIADRSATFDEALLFLSGRAGAAVVETGCIRAEEDWAGAGYSTYLFAAFLQAHGGQLWSCDLDERNVAFARAVCKPFFGTVTFEVGDSVNFLRSLAPAADLVYLDSADVGVPGYQEHALAEAQVAAGLVKKGGRILFDDTPWSAGGWQGKGAQAVPWLLDHGWQVVRAAYQVLLKRRAE